MIRDWFGIGDWCHKKITNNEISDFACLQALLPWAYAAVLAWEISAHSRNTLRVLTTVITAVDQTTCGKIPRPFEPFSPFLSLT
jgi:hypothetical protein